MIQNTTKLNPIIIRTKKPVTSASQILTKRIIILWLKQSTKWENFKK